MIVVIPIEFLYGSYISPSKQQRNIVQLCTNPRAVIASLRLDVFYFYFAIFSGKIPNLIGLIAKGGWNCTQIAQNATSYVFLKTSE